MHRCWSWWLRPTTFPDEKRVLLRSPSWTPSTSKSTRWLVCPRKKGSSIKCSGELSLCRPGQGQGWACHEEGLWAQFHHSQSSSGLLLKLQSSQNVPAYLQVEACFKKFDKDKDGMLNFVEFKNFMGKRKSLPDKVTFARIDLWQTLSMLQALARCTSTLSLRLAGNHHHSSYSITFCGTILHI